jgi:hypothetical protein
MKLYLNWSFWLLYDFDGRSVKISLSLLYKSNSYFLTLYVWLATLGITAQFLPKDGIGGEDCDLDVGFRYPRGVEASNGGSVRPLKSNMS